MKKTLCKSVLVLALLFNGISPIAVLAETVVASETFENYTVGESIIGMNGWVASQELTAGESAAVVADPEDPSNKVLRVESAADSGLFLKYLLNYAPNGGKVAISYKMKMIDNGSELPRFGWAANIGRPYATNLDGSRIDDTFLSYLFNGNNINTKDATSIMYTHNNTMVGFTAYDGWVQSNELFNMDTKKLRLILSKYNNNGTINIHKDGFDDSIYMSSKSNPASSEYMDSQVFTYLKFATFPQSPSVNSVVYYDDIKITKISDTVPLTVSAPSQSILPNEPIVLNFSNPVIKSTLLNGGLTIKSGGATLTNSYNVNLSEDGKTAYVTVNNLEYGKAYSVVVNNTVYDEAMQTLSQAQTVDIATAPNTGGNLVIKKVTFDETGYNLGQSVLSIDGWKVYDTTLLPMTANDSITVGTDPNEETNKVLKIQTTAGSKPAYVLPLNDIPDSGILKVKYKLKMPILPQGSSLNYSWGWSSFLGTLAAKNLTSGSITGMYSQTMFNGGSTPYISYRSLTKQDAGSAPAFGGLNQLTTIKDGWTIVEKYIDIDNDGQMKMISSKYFDDNKIANIVTTGMTEGYGKSQYADIPNYDVVTGILFGIDPQSSASAVTSATLYVDDISIERLPKYYIDTVSATYAMDGVFANFKVGNFNNCESVNKDGVFFVVAAYDKVTKKLLNISTQTLKHEYNYILRGKNSDYESIWEDGANPRTANLVEEDVQVRLTDLPSPDNFNLHAFLWNGVSLEPLTDNLSVTLQ